MGKGLGNTLRIKVVLGFKGGDVICNIIEGRSSTGSRLCLQH